MTSGLWRNFEHDLANIILKYAFKEENLNTNEPLGRIVYHYASLPSFSAIIQSQSLFCTNLNYLNDKKEFKFGVEQVLKVIDKLQLENYSDSILNEVKEKIEDFYKTERFVTCFSKEGDMLSQWRAYANQGKGISIGFDLHSLEDSIEQPLKGSPVLYNNQKQLKTIEDIIKIIIENYEQIKDRFDWSDYGYERLARLSIIDFLHRIVSSYKSDGFEEEKEFRLEYSIDGNFVKHGDDEVLYRATETMLVPYVILQNKYSEYKKRIAESGDTVEHTFINKKLPIKEIIVGPSLDFDLTKASLQGLLKKLEYENVIIKKSKIPYRI